MPAMLARHPAHKEILKRARLRVNRHSAARWALELILFLMAFVDTEDCLFAVLLALGNSRTVGTPQLSNSV
jgi:hypothetical protein